jgi:hypothetical protein
MGDQQKDLGATTNYICTFGNNSFLWNTQFFIPWNCHNTHILARNLSSLGLMYNGMCCVTPGKVLKRNSGSKVPRWANISEWAVKQEQCPPIPSMFHNVMVFMICTMGMRVCTMSMRVCTIGMRVCMMGMWTLNNG